MLIVYEVDLRKVASLTVAELRAHLVTVIDV